VSTDWIEVLTALYSATALVTFVRTSWHWMCRGPDNGAFVVLNLLAAVVTSALWLPMMLSRATIRWDE
jgi:hypothetical protein